MSLLTYLVLFVVAAYLFKVNPVLCVVLVGAVAFFKVRGFFGGQRSQTRSNGNAATETALVAMCIALLGRTEQDEKPSQNRNEKSNSREVDPLEGLFLD